ncbi:anion permease [Tetragenococcus muriaticus]|uniref:2-oxoglutarate/malate translocator n=1 Tax=Tetragenococcus muriaticus 3MR10-3 TaxID=1302648 RepID=A0A091BUF2_9ENTE|nr:anion permease [Tetragenococcus muriaticus]KFN89296.1 2-oxoglutarate/malate translocator [Tetragenococcus muriaticus 3MR10-3]
MAESKFNRQFFIHLAIPLLIGIIIWFLPWRPEEVPVAGWQMLAIFVATIVAIILKPLPMGAIALIGLTLTIIIGPLSTETALNAFAGTSVWLIVLAFFLSKGIIKTGLGYRIAYLLIEKFGKKTIGLVYAITGVNIVVGPAIPSSTARTGGVMLPIVQGLAEIYDSRPQDGTRKKIGAFLITCLYHIDTIVATMFLTAGATKPLAQELAAGFGIEITWMNWFLGALVPGLLSLILIPLVLLKLYPPEIKETPGAPSWAKEKRQEIGPMTLDEKNMSWIFVLAIVLWVSGQFIDLSAVTVALIAVSLLLLLKILEWNDITQEKGAWNTLIWFAILVMMAGQLNELGFIPWFSDAIASVVTGWSWIAIFAVLCLAFFYTHYFFASLTAHVTAMYPAFLGVALASGAPPLFAALMLAYITNICGATTHYASGPAAVLFGEGYVTQNEWWKLCFIMGLTYLFIWLVIGSGWMNLIGFM